MSFADIRAAIDATERETAATLADRDARIADLEKRLAEATKPQQPKIRWGTSIERRNGETASSALARVKKALGNIGAVRYYHQPDDGIKWPLVDASPKADELSAADMAGIALHYSCKPNLAAVAAGSFDEQLRAWCRSAVARYRATGIATTFTLMHEADVKVRQGQFTVASYRAAADRVHGIINAEFPPEAIIPCPNFTRYLLKAGPRLADITPKGSRAIAWDVYKSDPNTTVAYMLDELRATMKQLGLPWLIFETAVNGSNHTSAQRYAALLELATSLATVEPKPLAVDYFNSNPGGGAGTLWPIDGNQAAIDAWTKGQTAA